MSGYFDVSFLSFVMLNTSLRPQLFQFFSSGYNSNNNPTTISQFNTTIIFIYSLIYAFNVKVDVSNPGSFLIQIRFKTRNWCSFLLYATSSILSLIFPTSVFFFVYPFIILVSLRSCFGRDTSGSMPIQSFFYELRWCILIPINKFIRPELQALFSDYSTATSSAAAPQNVFGIGLMLVLFLVVSPTLCLTNDTQDAPYILLRVQYRDAWPGLLLTSALIFSLLFPTLTFLYPVIILVSLWPSFFLATLRRFFIRLSAAVSAFRSANVYTMNAGFREHYPGTTMV